MRALWVSVFAFIVSAAAAAVLLAAIIPARSAPINVRWRAEVSPPQHATLERRFHLADGRPAEATTWPYELTDTSFTNIRALVRAPLVDHPANINQRFFRPAFAFDRVARIAIAGVATGVVAVVLVFAQSRISSAAGTTRVPGRALIAIAGIPPASVLACAVIVLLLAAAGFEPLWASRDVTLVEASHSGDIAGAYRLVSTGSDPNQSGAVQLEAARVATLTPLEAAVESRQVEVLQVLVHAGAGASEDERQTLVCLAAAVNAPEVADYLQSTLAPSAQPDCTHIEIPPY